MVGNGTTADAAAADPDQALSNAHGARIVEGVDGSDEPRAALRWAVTDARLHGLGLHPPIRKTRSDGTYGNLRGCRRFLCSR